MPVDINDLLALPQRERRRIAEKLWKSLSPNNSMVKEEKEVIDLLNKRWENIQSGKSKVYNYLELKEQIAHYRANKVKKD